MSDKPRILYSSDGSHEKQCKTCGHYPCECKVVDINPSNLTLKIRRETSGRGGKAVTVVFEFPSNPDYFKNLTTRLKTQCGTGGTFKETSIEIQGDHREKIKAILEKMGFKVKLAGG
jgi:translation initiation factor 1